ncbi:hypothetical protein FF38_01110 [Lucilia cuprina]|uniref:Uncharacterized protein n=1 Tax=Lucilia cuprina TaxID=7375 RepID=A0A0L0CFZ6_LUCCU|nr:hypothetical protein CVS40_11861 [Lucilia cuprina]KNC31333.1 hypothetical protein FF38_01110 [Lucilia cuprina]
MTIPRNGSSESSSSLSSGALSLWMSFRKSSWTCSVHASWGGFSGIPSSSVFSPSSSIFVALLFGYNAGTGPNVMEGLGVASSWLNKGAKGGGSLDIMVCNVLIIRFSHTFLVKSSTSGVPDLASGALSTDWIFGLTSNGGRNGGSLRRIKNGFVYTPSNFFEGYNTYFAFRIPVWLFPLFCFIPSVPVSEEKHSLKNLLL